MFPVDQSTQEAFQQFAEAIDSGDYDRVDPDHAGDHLRDFMTHASPEAQQQVFALHFSRLPPRRREQIAQQVKDYCELDASDPLAMAASLSLMGRNDPDALRELMGTDGDLRGAIGATGIIDLAGLMAKQAMGEQLDDVDVDATDQASQDDQNDQVMPADERSDDSDSAV